MRIKYLFLFSATLGLALAASVQAGQDDKGARETTKTRRIVRVFSTSNGPTTIESDAEGRFVVVGGGRILAPRVLAGLSHRRGYLGVQMVDLTPELRSHFGAPEKAGVMISTVVKGSPAAQAGLRVGDIVTAINGEVVTSGFEVARKVSAQDDQAVATLEVWRGGSVRTLSATIIEKKRPAIDIGRMVLPDAGPLHERVWFGRDEFPEHIIEIDQGRLRDALHELELRFDKPDFVEKFKMLGQDRLDLQLHIEKLEERLNALEQQLDKLPSE